MNRWMFWLAYLLISVWAQHLLPGVDVLAPGLIVSMQRHGGARSLWLAGLMVIIQEGLGSLAFGSCILFYAGLLAAYYGGREVFQRGSALFTVLLAAFYGLLTSFGAVLMAGLQDATVDLTGLPRRAMAQALVFIVAWAICYVAHEQLVRYEPQR